MTDRQDPAPGRGGIGAVPPEPAPVEQGLSDEERTWGMFAHLFVFLGYIGLPFANWIGPAIPYFMYKDKSRFVRFHALQSFAFQCMVWILGSVLAVPIVLIGVFTAGIGWLLLFPVLVAAWIGTVVYVVILGLKANKGELAEYAVVGAWARQKVYQEDWKPV
ncbi:MAG: DUF4870 domain-containing protein [Planctomycetota bacterium]|nr:DUF4870 domain-containing protein [Planctomycetota bacterium]